MNRKIIGFYQDEFQDWVAGLECWHGQHVRHKPPFIVRQWTQTESGRAARVGTFVQCLKCDRLEWPDALEPFERTPEYTLQSTPAELARDHATAIGIWGRIHVLAGELQYVITEPEHQESRLTPSSSGVIAPGMVHHLQIRKPVRFYIEYFSRGGAD